MTHENEALCDFIDETNYSVNESVLFAGNPSTAYYVVRSIKLEVSSGVNIQVEFIVANILCAEVICK